MSEAGKLDGYVEIYRRGESGSSGSFQIAIMVKLPPEHTAEVMRQVEDYRQPHVSLGGYVEQILEHIKMVTAQNDPTTKERQECARSVFRSIFQRAGLPAIYMEQLPNGYCDKSCCIHEPWWRVTSRLGPITIGWRKRVINIDWSNSAVPKNCVKELFADEDVTKAETMIHAWSEEKAVDYLRRLATQVSE